jgi:hypothetical protein
MAQKEYILRLKELKVRFDITLRPGEKPIVVSKCMGIKVDTSKKEATK